MAKDIRLVLVRGEWHEVSCALLADGVTAPVKELLELLDQGEWPDPNVSEFPDERQAKHKLRFLANLEQLADYGDLERDYNFLEDGVWEFKVESLRVTFYDTPGDGTYSPKDGVHFQYWARRYELPEDFDYLIRLGHYFGKNSQKAPRAEINRAFEVRKEDLAHDCN